MEQISVRCKIVDEKLTPKYLTSGSAACDVCCANATTIEPGKIGVISTGLKIEIPLSFSCLIKGRSSLAINKLLCFEGLIDCDFRDEIKVVLFNFSENAIHIKKSQRIGQLLFVKYYKANFIDDSVPVIKKPRFGGFGSTNAPTDHV